MAIAFVDAVATNFADTAASPHAHARTIAIGDAITVIITASQISNTWATLTGLTDNGAGGGNIYTKKGSTITATGMKSEIWTTIATVAATIINLAYAPSSSGQWTMASMRRTGVAGIGALVTATGNTQASAVIGSPVTQDPNNWIDYIVLEGSSNAGSGYTSLPTPLSTFTRRMNGGTWETVGSIDNMGVDADLLIAAAGGSQTLTQPLNFANDVWIAFALELRSVLSVASASARLFTKTTQILATDNFNRADANPLAGNWTTGLGDFPMQLVGNSVRTTSDNDASSLYTGISWPPDQYSKAKLSEATAGAGADSGICLVVRGSTTANTHYRLTVNHGASNNVHLSSLVAGVYTLLLGWDVVTQAWVDGDIWELWVFGNTLFVFRNGVQVGPTTTDASIATGIPGVGYSSTSSLTLSTVEDWEGGGSILRFLPQRRASSQQRAA